MRKTIFFSLMALLLVLGCSKSDDSAINPGENQLKSATHDLTVPMSFKEAFTSSVKKIPIECDGVIIDHLTGTLDVFCRMFGYYPAGQEGNDNAFVSEWMIHNYSGTLTSTSASGEVFEIQGFKKMDMIEANFTFHLNIKGSLGSHYIIIASGTNAPNYSFTIEKAVCPQNDSGE